MPLDVRWTDLATARVRGGVLSVLTWLGAASVLAAGAIHVHLWDIAYRHVSTLGPLFLIQAALCLVLAVVVSVTRRVAYLVVATIVMLGTMLGLLLASTTGLFGFTLPRFTVWAYLSLLFEGGAALLFIVAVSATYVGLGDSRGSANRPTERSRITNT